MTSSLYHYLLWAYFALAPVVLLALLVVPAPYGRYTRKSFGPSINRRIGWLVMELPSPVLVAVLLGLNWRSMTAVSVVFLLMWQAHYIHRTFIFPWRMRGSSQQMTVFAMLLGFLFNCGNGYVNGLHLGHHQYDLTWFGDPRFIAGAALFVVGYGINRYADAALRRLRTPQDTGYHIPRGGLFELVSCPNYLGEIIEWLGWALATWSLPGLAFALFTIANLAPRALAHHRWYRREFPDYPKTRHALLPFIL